ncbi:ABC transporter permease [Deinococcus taeanensis]|uniref:ABC transporter permease n=1 Tax=Deinococcus taeanensis TaxID=2737050 RepID=UPI001CDC75C9|nr:ABC transporter permease [Deinococcus taeanensis]UBV42556.1 ABC transporter permease [Deinococcus taeanensis]
MNARVDGGAGTTVSPALPSAAPRDVRAVLWLSALPMLTGALLPWVLLRPNRLAPGDYLRLPPPWLAVALTLALLPALTGQGRRGLVWLPATVALILGVWLLGTRTAAALAGQAAFARASAASGVWLYLLGAGISVYAARLAAPERPWLVWLWLPAVAALTLVGTLEHWSVLVEGQQEAARWRQELTQHLRLVGSALVLAVLLGAPLAVWAAGRARLADAVLGAANAVQTLPSLALLGLLIAPLAALARAFPVLREAGISGIGVAPALTAMTLYALLPVVRNGVVALRGVPAGVVDAARGMGMTAGQRFWRVLLPLALPVWLGGVRQAAVLLVGVAAVAALIGAGGLGTYIFKGLQSAAPDLILLGAIPAALLAILLDGALRLAELWLGGRLGRTT